MPTGTIGFESKALTAVGGTDETRYYSFKLPITNLKNGSNVVAVSVHQDQATSSDLTFDMEVMGELKTSASIDCAPGGDVKIGCFTSIKPSAQTELFVYPESHTFQQLVKSGVTKFTSGGTGFLPGGNDFTAYIPKSGSSTEGYLSINHENHPGGVSILNLNFNQQSMLWEVNGVHKMDFSPVSGTSRNCSGGITPWGNCYFF
jgi:secreted PhoX family phosphatase